MKQTNLKTAKRKKHPKLPYPHPVPDDDDDEDGLDFSASQLICGDLSIASKRGGLKICENTLRRLLSDKLVKGYLKSYEVKKLLTSSSYIG